MVDFIMIKDVVYLLKDTVYSRQVTTTTKK